MEYFIIDRIEGKFAACEDSTRSTFNILLEKLPHNVHEGDCIVCENGQYIIDANETQRRREENIKLLRELMRKD